jgi:hypothetical protein
MSLPGQKVLGLGQQASLQPFRLPLAGSLHGKAVDELLVASRLVPGVIARMTRFGSNSSEGNEDFALQPVLGWPERSLAVLTDAESLAIGQNADALDRAA